jgi:hypothetical protein
MEYQRKLSAGKIDTTEERQIQEQLKNTQRVLQPVQIRNPYAEQLKIPNEVFKPRRTNAHYLAFIEAVTFYHQYQRERKIDRNPDGSGQAGEEYIETTLEDIAAANQLMKEVLLRKSDPLTGACRNYFEWLKTWMKKEKKTSFTNKEVRQAIRIHPSNQKRYMLQLQDYDYVDKIKGEKGQVHHYQITTTEDYERLKGGIESILDEILQNLGNKKRKTGS